MTISDIVAISGKPGLFKIGARRNDGLIVSELDGSNKKFIAARVHMFSPLDSITIYTDDDAVPLAEVFQKMKDENVSLPNAKKSSGKDLRDFFNTVLPNHDQDRVYTSDIKKIIKWFELMNSYNVEFVTEEDKKASAE